MTILCHFVVQNNKVSSPFHFMPADAPSKKAKTIHINYHISPNDVIVGWRAGMTDAMDVIEWYF